MNNSEVTLAAITRLTETEVRARLVETSVKEIKEISASHSRNLKTGCYQPTDYYSFAQDNHLQDRVDWAVKNGVTYHGYASSKHFDMQIEKECTSLRKVCTFFLKKGVLPHDAVHQMKKGLSLIGNGETVQLAQYLAIEGVVDTYTPGKFNTLFAADSKTPLIIGSKADNNPISRLRNYMMKPVSADSVEIKKGDHIHYPNAKSYLEKHLNGVWTGCNLLCIDDAIGSQKFTTLGLPADGYTHIQLQDHHLAKFNLIPQSMMGTYSEETRKELLTKYYLDGSLERATSLAEKQMTVEEFMLEGGGAMQIVDELDVKRITALANASIPQARKLMDSYDVRKGERQQILEV